MKKILFIHQHYFPEMAGTARRTKELAEGLARRGYDCSVLTSFPREYRSVPGYNALPEETINNVKVHRINTFIDVTKNVILRLTSYSLFFLLTVVWLVKNRKNFDFIISIAPLSSGIAGAFANKFLKIPHHFDVPDILPDLGIAAGMIRNPSIIKLFYRIEKWVYDNATTVSAITEGQVQNIIKKGVAPSKISLIPDWVDVDFFSENSIKYHDDIYRKVKSEANLKIISFVGNIGALQGIETFLDVVKLLNNEYKKKFKFLFVGDGIMLPVLKERVIKENIPNIEFIGRVPREHVPAYMAISDVLVANYVDNSYMEICIPGKTYEYIISKRPIVIGARGEAANLVKKFGAGIPVLPSDADGFKNAIIQIFREPEKFEYGVDEFARKYNHETVVDYYVKIIENYNHS